MNRGRISLLRLTKTIGADTGVFVTFQRHYS
jgi:hypothetical protein